MATMVESRDNSTGGHIKRTSDCIRILVDEITKQKVFNLSEAFCKNLIKAAPMHDLGKIAVDDQVLRKPGKFTPEEFEEMKKHAAEGARIVHEILKSTDDVDFKIIAENVAHYHHERWDGSGYPSGLKGDNIPLEARIMAIADVYDALVSKRVYKESMSFEKADKIIMESFGKHFDKRLEPCYVSARPRLEEYYLKISSYES
jgi:putative two-component system response regulator